MTSVALLTRRAVLAAAVATAATAAVADSPGQTIASPIDTASLSTEIKACSDFYRYVNARWAAATEIPADRSSWGAFDELDKRNKAVVKEVLQAAVANPALAAESAQRKVADYYVSGMDTQQVERAGLEPLAAEFSRIEALKSRIDLVEALAHFQRIGAGAGFDFNVNQDAKDSTRYLAEIEQGGLGLPDRDYYFRSDEKSKKQRQEYLRHVAKMFELMGDKPELARQEADKVMAIETRLAKASMTKVERRNPRAVYNKMQLTGLAKQAPGVDWARYFKAVGVAELGEVNVAQPKFFHEFAAATAAVPLSDWKIYLRWHLIHASASKLPGTFEDENFRFYGMVLSGKKTMRPRDDRVVETITGRYGEAPLAMALGELYVAKAFPPEAKARALELVNNVKAVLHERLAELDWMSEPTRQAALAKLDAMAIKIGYPDKWRDYSTLKIDRGPYIQNWLRANEFESRRQIDQLGKPVDRGEWGMSPPTVNAYYNPQLNEIVFPAGILQPPFFDSNRDDAMNYGGIGMVIGHEITHGFDDQGRQFDAQGNLKDWWTKEDAQRYTARASIVEKQYGNYQGVDGLHLNGKLTLGENIADLGGMKLAYLALRKALKEHPAAPIDGLTSDQRFFISYAQIWREKETPESERMLITTNPHSPPRFRVQGPLANMPEFAKAFSCQASDVALRAEGERVNIW
jgi:putative endopeptidase